MTYSASTRGVFRGNEREALARAARAARLPVYTGKFR
jgi:hypothetical protein